MTKLKTIFVFALMMFTSVTFSQNLKVATGSSSGTYSKMFKELQETCKDTIMLSEQNSNGSMDNIDMLTGNTVNGAFVQTDVLFYRSRTEDLSNVKTLVTLHPEEVHFVTLTTPNIKEGGTMGFGAKQVQFNSINDLVGRTVVASGGSYITAQVIRLQTEINFNIVEAKTNDDAIKMITTGQAHAAVLVGGSPLPILAPLTNTYKLLEIPEATVAKLKNVYVPAKLNYSKMSSTGVSTVATNALFVTRQYKTDTFVKGLTNLRACINKNVDVLSETTGKHPKWQAVKVGDTGKWSYYDLTSKK
jgi:TRAP-type uncharacterized transport system substrate-binding protein